MLSLFKEISKQIKVNEDVILVSVVTTSGSLPRGAGARMVVGESGLLSGTIGGGEVEYQSIQRAHQLLKEKRSEMMEYLLHPNDVADLGMVCGGDVSVYFNYLEASDPLVTKLVSDVEMIYQSREPAYLVTEIKEDSIPQVIKKEKGFDLWGKSLYKSNQVVIKDQKKYHVEAFVFPNKVYVFGGGHVAQALVPVLDRINFECVVLDDRDEFTRDSLFEYKAYTKTIDFENDNIYDQITSEDFVCIMTRGHHDDYLVQKKVLKTDAYYIGVIGSKRKVAAVSKRLKDDGFTDQDLARIVTPIGLDIYSETPAEIAISIAAEMIAVRNKPKK